MLRRLRSAASAQTTAPRCARLEGFSLHADVAVPARRRDQLERVCRYLLRPPLALERLTESSGGQLLYQFRRPWRDGSTALLLEPLELLERLAALVPPPRRPLLAYHGVLAPHARWRSAIVPKPSPADARAAAPVPRRWPWAQLLHRVFAIQVLVCPRCGGPRRILGAVTEPHAVRRLLAALRLAAEAAARAAGLGRLTRRARRPPRHAVVPVCPPPSPVRGSLRDPLRRPRGARPCRAAPPRPKLRPTGATGRSRPVGRSAKQGRRNVLWTSYVQAEVEEGYFSAAIVEAVGGEVRVGCTRNRVKPSGQASVLSGNRTWQRERKALNLLTEWQPLQG